MRVITFLCGLIFCLYGLDGLVRANILPPDDGYPANIIPLTGLSARMLGLFWMLVGLPFLVHPFVAQRLTPTSLSAHRSRIPAAPSESVGLAKNTVGPWPDPEIPSMDEEGLMRPPWVKYPNLPRASSGWRMGIGEAYRDDFRSWWSRQLHATCLRVKAAYPEPKEWEGFYQGAA